MRTLSMEQDRLRRISFCVFAKALIGKQSEDTKFSAVFSVVREKSRNYKEKLEFEAKDVLQKMMKEDIEKHGYKVVSVEVSLGKYRGSRFVTSGKVVVLSNTVGQASALDKVLQEYHSGYVLKEYDSETKIAVYNIR